MLAIGLGAGVYILNVATGSHQQLTELPCGEEGGYVSSVSWSRNGKFLAVGGSDAVVQLWDVEKCKKVRSMRGHRDRVGALSWNKHTLARSVMMTTMVVRSSCIEMMKLTDFLFQILIN